MKRTTQDLLAERRYNVQEMRCEKDATARAMLQFHIDQLDREIRDMSEVWTMGEWSDRMQAVRS